MDLPGKNQMNKIAIVSDIHGNLAALERVIEDIRVRRVEAVFNLGDHLSGPLYPRETLALLQKTDWIHIMGNHDRNLIAQDPGEHGLSDRYAFSRLGKTDLDWLRELPDSLSMRDECLCFHGSPGKDTTFLLETAEGGRTRLATPKEIANRLAGQSAPLLLCGHSHIPRVVQTNGTLIVNPGSVGLQAYDDDFPEYLVIETGSPHARYAVLERTQDGWRAELIAVPYDHQDAARQAGRNGRPDWEVALETGFMPPAGDG
jgi:putative phosphoesterase